MRRTLTALSAALGAAALAIAFAGPGATTAQAQHDCNDDITVRGTVTEFLYNPNGTMEGFLLHEGTKVRFPASDGQRVDQAIDEGDPVEVEGCRVATADGGSYLRADEIENQRTGQEVDVDDDAPLDA